MKFQRMALLVSALALTGVAMPVSAQVSCTGLPAFASCTAYANGASVTYNGSKYTSIAAIPNNRDCPPAHPFDPSTDNWWTNNGTCTGGATATRTATATATRTPTATARSGATATRTNTATATATGGATATRTPTATSTTPPTATPTSGGGTTVTCLPAWNSTSVYQNTDPQGVSRAGSFQYVNDAGQTQTQNYTRNYTASYWNQGVDPSATNNACPAGQGCTWIPGSFCGTLPAPIAGNVTASISSAQFNQMFPSRNPFYYDFNQYVAAANAYPAFATTGDANTRKREVAAMAANNAHEGGGLWYIREIGQPAGYCAVPGDPAWPSLPSACTCTSGQSYFGRGPIQLSWNQNYCNFSEYTYGNNNTGDGVNRKLLDNPDLLAQNPSLAWKSALWYWNTQTGPSVSGWPLETAHDAITTTDPSGNYGFGGTIRAINGTLECNGGNGAQVTSRINLYNTMKGILGVTGTFGRDGC